MSGFAICLTALALAQAGPAAGSATGAEASAPEPAPVETTSPVAAPPARGSPATPTPAATEASPTVRPEHGADAPAEARSPRAPAAPSTSTLTPPAPPEAPSRKAPAAPATPARRSAGAATSAPALDPARAPGAPAQRAPPTTPAPGPVPAPGARPEPDREQARRVAQAFLEALASGDAAELARASAERFSFDGEAQSGREGIQRAWRALLAGRPGPAPRVNAVEVLAAPEAVARYGKPPPRVAALVRAGVWIAVGDVGGRPVVLFLAREGGRLAVLGIHD